MEQESTFGAPLTVPTGSAARSASQLERLSSSSPVTCTESFCHHLGTKVGKGVGVDQICAFHNTQQTPYNTEYHRTDHLHSLMDFECLANIGATYCGTDMHDMGVALNLHEFLHFHCPSL